MNLHEKREFRNVPQLMPHVLLRINEPVLNLLGTSEVSCSLLVSDHGRERVRKGLHAPKTARRRREDHQYRSLLYNINPGGLSLFPLSLVHSCHENQSSPILQLYVQWLKLSARVGNRGG